MTLMKMLRLVCYAALCLTVLSCKKSSDTHVNGSGKINLEFDHRVGTQALQLNTQTYTNANGDDFKVSVFKYYVSNISLSKADGSKVKIPESYLLIDAGDARTTMQNLQDIPTGDYTSIDFIIGVDEARNFAGAQTGALDPARGMFWTWNTGYIFLKFEGASSKSTQAANQLFFHVGGAKDPTNAIRNVSLTLPVALRVRTDSEPDVHLMVDLSALFKGKNIINFAAVSGFHGGANSLLMADNYANGLFKVDHIHN